MGRASASLRAFPIISASTRRAAIELLSGGCICVIGTISLAFITACLQGFPADYRHVLEFPAIDCITTLKCLLLPSMSHMQTPDSYDL